MLAGVFAGERRVWRAAAIAAVPALALILAYCLSPRDYFTGTNNVEVYTYVAQAAPGEAVCVPGLHIPAGTGRIRLQLLSRTRLRPALTLRLALSGADTAEGTDAVAGADTGAGTDAGERRLESHLAPESVGANRISDADFAVPTLPARPVERAASLCLTAADVVNWGGTPLTSPPSSSPPTAGGHPVAGRIAVWYLPPAGVRRSYLSRAGAILDRASLFRPGFVGPWLYALILIVLLPALALAAVRCLALAAGGRPRRLAVWLFAIAALNFICWSLITPPFQAPDEVDHFAYAQSLIERGEEPSRNPDSPLARWSSAESLALEDTSFSTDHQVGDTRPPWSARQQREYQAQARSQRPSAANGGGNETDASYGPLYYGALAPAYLLASASPLDQLTLMRALSALIGALVVVFAFLLMRELAPARPWLAVLAALLVCYEPMYGFISGTVNNDVGVNAGAAALELLLIRMLRRGITVRSGLFTGALLFALPLIKGTALSLYPVAAVALVASLWRRHDRVALRAWAALAAGALVVELISEHVLNKLQGAPGANGSTNIGSASIGANAGAVSEAAHHIPTFASYLWQALLPRLPFMTRYFPEHPPGFVLTHDAGFNIFVERGWGAFGWYDVLFAHWVYVVIFLVMLLAVPAALWAARREWSWVRRHPLELAVLIAFPVFVTVGFEAAYYSPAPRAAIAEFGRYAFPAIAPLAVLVVGALHAFGRRRMLAAGVTLLVAMLALSYASQLLTLTSFYA
jgi:hypothetical protein